MRMNRKSFYNQPIKSVQVMLQTIAHADSEYASVIPDGIYGPETVEAVATFQRNQGMPATGTVDQTTWDRIVDVFESAEIELAQASAIQIDMPCGLAYQKGEHNFNIQLAQSMLQALSERYQCICAPAISGMLDDATTASIEELQAMCNLPVSGQIDKRTWDALVRFYPMAVSSGNDTGNKI